ncbi:hypothetical protein BBO99_00004519 [Phytophthora kernoviae]|uniref:Uncharacterized protein n=1 Tax=Phytophthora kernoviae TaxID=325452 RepID=A0A3R7GZX7_9STRA|nr:hypothetical protein BBI17_004711 [Phytophthora kernoviae]RLN80401.1 hypothetical protein BBO99_00004519 [Phytophthora kernoviae]
MCPRYLSELASFPPRLSVSSEPVSSPPRLSVSSELASSPPRLSVSSELASFPPRLSVSSEPVSPAAVLDTEFWPLQLALSEQASEQGPLEPVLSLSVLYL